MSRSREISLEIRRAARPGRVLAIDPDAHTPGVAVWDPATLAVLAWGGNSTGTAAGTPDGARAILERLEPGLVIIEAPLTNGGPWAASMHGQNIVRGGWVWLATLSRAPVILIPPGVWQWPLTRGARGSAAAKQAYKAHARALAGVSTINEDAAAAIGIMVFALGALDVRADSWAVGRAPV